jgi:hypothetical protein
MQSLPKDFEQYMHWVIAEVGRWYAQVQNILSFLGLMVTTHTDFCVPALLDRENVELVACLKRIWMEERFDFIDTFVIYNLEYCHHQHNTIFTTWNYVYFIHNMFRPTGSSSGDIQTLTLRALNCFLICYHISIPFG